MCIRDSAPSAHRATCAGARARLGAQVYRVRNRADGREYAVKASKRLFRTRNERKLLLREVENSQLLGEHAHIVCYYRAWQDQRSLYLQLELCERGTLRAHVASIVEHATHAGAATAGGVGSARVGLPEGQAWAFTAQLASGLAHIHAHGLLHLDVKPENILVTRDGMLKIGDLGLCVSAGEWEEQVGRTAPRRAALSFARSPARRGGAPRG